ncbi:hypothetical protein SPWS13_3249 [Shewanella putrefaciens]|nr:hypothetical protein SPWS13_3249 [Shewanella putrefaciens]
MSAKPPLFRPNHLNSRDSVSGHCHDFATIDQQLARNFWGQICFNISR